MSDAAHVIERVRRVLASGEVEWSSREPEWLLEAAGGDAAGAASSRPVPSEVQAKAVELARRRAGGEPLQYLTGLAGFRRLELRVGPGVLVPRPETEVVAERAMQLLRPGGTMVDVGTGSGAIALAAADERPDATVWGTDTSLEALGWARSNAEALGLPVRFVRADLLDGCPAELRRRIDVVVANLPYVAESEAGLLPKDVVEHEPHVALFAGPEGLSAITSIAQQAVSWLSADGWLVLEIGEWQGGQVRSLLQGIGYRDVALHEDLTGRDRVIEARTPS
jgi:release factor glutamine methyltransferase